jgi:hypothetical protein
MLDNPYGKIYQIMVTKNETTGRKIKICEYDNDGFKITKFSSYNCIAYQDNDITVYLTNDKEYARKLYKELTNKRLKDDIIDILDDTKKYI